MSDSTSPFFTNETTAQKKANEIIGREIPWFCPLTRKECNPNCYCFQGTRVVQLTLKKFVIQEACCDNAMFSGSECRYE